MRSDERQLILMWRKDNWKRLKRLKIFKEIFDEVGSVSMKELANRFGESKTASHNWNNYCLRNGITKRIADGGYGMTYFGDKLIGDGAE